MMITKVAGKTMKTIAVMALFFSIALHPGRLN